MQGRHRGLPLQLFVSGAIVISMLVLALVLIANSYFSQRETLISESGIRARQIADNLDSHLEGLINPIKSTVQMLTLDPVVRASDFQARRARLPMLAQALKVNSVLSAVYVGYTDGSFVLLRHLQGDAARDASSAPERAAYLMQSVERSPKDESFSGVWHYFDADLRFLESRLKPDYDYDPRSRPWFVEASQTNETILTQPYIFFTTGEIGLTLAQRNPITGAVIGVDASVQDLSKLVGAMKAGKDIEVAVVTGQGEVIAYPDMGRILREGSDDSVRLARIDELGVPALQHLFGRSDEALVHAIDLQGETWFGTAAPMTAGGQADAELLFSIPESTLLADAKNQGGRQILWSLLIMLVLLLVGWRIGRVISRPLQTLSHQVSALAAFDFSQRVELKSPVREVNRLSHLIGQMSGAINGFQHISHTLAHERDLDLMLSRVTDQLVTITSAAAGVLYLHDEAQNQFNRAAQSGVRGSPKAIKGGESGLANQRARIREALAREGDTVLTTELVDRNGELLGVLALILPPEVASAEEAYRHFVEEVSGSAATAIDTRRQVEAQQALIDSIIRLLADAIDAKSPYTHGHCERVPQLAEMLVDAAQASKHSTFAKFGMNEQQRREFRIAAWLHDCGKVTSPEYVVDKATKLESLYNRIHEVRTRFEVIWRDAEIGYLRGVLRGGVEADLRAQRDRLRKALQQEFALVARANVGGEFMPSEDIEKLHQIGKRRWKRHFDRRLGLSRDELARLPDEVEELPVTEYLLADRPEHKIPWEKRRPPVEAGDPDNIWGFDMTLPEHASNQGELYNLSIQKGTLTDEERFIINDHIVQTIRMLNALPLPKELKRVPEIAGNHHEKVDGTGYPRKLDASKLSVEERIMALADVFEALTAADRPYKDAKTLSESLRILAFMVKDRHLDADLFRLFLESGVYLRYAEAFLKPEQIDAVDRRQLLTLAGLS